MTDVQPLPAEAGTEVRLAELVGAMSVATDTAMGQPVDRGAGVRVLTMAIGRAAGVSEDELADAWYVSLLRHVGCTADAHLFSALVGDEVAYGTGAASIEGTKPSAVGKYTLGLMFQRYGVRALPKLAGLS